MGVEVGTMPILSIKRVDTRHWRLINPSSCNQCVADFGRLRYGFLREMQGEWEGLEDNGKSHYLHTQVYVITPWLNPYEEVGN
jgi:hypothetical protein